MEYFVSCNSIHDLQSELNALVEQGFDIVNIFAAGQYQDVSQFVVVARKRKESVE